MCSYFIVGNKIFCFFKKRVFPSSDEDTSRWGGGGKFSKILRGVAHKGGSDRFRIFGEDLGKKG